MITDAHVLLYSSAPAADRQFLRDVLGFPSVDAGEDWLIFALPSAELAVHPGEQEPMQQHAGHALLGAVLYLVCDDVQVVIRSLKSRNVACTEVESAPWGIRTTIQLPSCGEIGLCQPTHPTALGLKSS
jgi:hypothetical protein